MPRVFKRLDEAAVKYARFVNNKIDNKKGLFANQFIFREWKVLVQFHRNKGIQPYLEIIVYPEKNDVPDDDIDSLWAFEIRWYDSNMCGNRTIDIKCGPQGYHFYIRIFYGFPGMEYYDETVWLAKTIKEKFNLTLYDVDLLSSKFTELIIKMI